MSFTSTPRRSRRDNLLSSPSSPLFSPLELKSENGEEYNLPSYLEERFSKRLQRIKHPHRINAEDNLKYYFGRNHVTLIDKEGIEVTPSLLQFKKVIGLYFSKDPGSNDYTSELIKLYESVKLEYGETMLEIIQVHCDKKGKQSNNQEQLANSEEKEVKQSNNDEQLANSEEKEVKQSNNEEQSGNAEEEEVKQSNTDEKLENAEEKEEIAEDENCKPPEIPWLWESSLTTPSLGFLAVGPDTVPPPIPPVPSASVFFPFFCVL